MLSFPLASQLSEGWRYRINNNHLYSASRAQGLQLQQWFILRKLINYSQRIITLIMKNLTVIYGQLNYNAIGTYQLGPPSITVLTTLFAVTNHRWSPVFNKPLRRVNYTEFPIIKLLFHPERELVINNYQTNRRGGGNWCAIIRIFTLNIVVNHRTGMTIWCWPSSWHDAQYD